MNNSHKSLFKLCFHNYELTLRFKQTNLTFLVYPNLKNIQMYK